MDMKRDYYEDVQLLRRPAARAWFTVLVLLLLSLPAIVPSYSLFTINFMAVFVIVALGLNILVGYTGQVSLGHAGFLAIGAYGTVLTMSQWQLPFVLALLGGGAIAAAFGFLLGLPALRLEGPYLAIATLGFGLAVTQIIGRTAMFGGHMGLSMPSASFLGVPLGSDVARYYVIAGAALLLGLMARNLMVSRVGRAFRAIRDSDIAAATLGVNVGYYKTLSFAVSAAYAGVAGGLMALASGYISPGQFQLTVSVMFLAMVVVGGLGSTLGSVLGGLVMGYLGLKMDVVQELPGLGPLLRFLSEQFMTLGGLPNVGWIFTGLVLILIVVFEPMGMYGLWIRARVYWGTWPY